MKDEILDKRSNPGRAGGRPGRTGALVGGLVLALTLPVTGLKAQVPDITKSVLLSWPEPSEEQIVVGADSLTSPVWTPWPEPIFKRFAQMCMTVPTTANSWFAKLVPGRYFVDDFSDSWGPFTNRTAWTPWFHNPGEEWMVADGVLKMFISSPPQYAGLALCPLGATNTEAVLWDFSASVDILDWVTSSNNWSSFALMGRVRFNPTSGGTGYFGGLTLNSGATNGLIEPWLLGPDPGYPAGEPFYVHQYPPPYRLQFSMVGTNMSFRVLRLATGQPIRQMSWNGSILTNGVVGLWFNGRKNPGDYYTNTVDNFSMSGTKQ